MKVSFCSSWNREKDGIADYSAYLVKELQNLCDVKVVELGHFIADKAYYKTKANEANSGDLVHIQFNYLYFNGGLPYRNKFLYFARHIKKPIIMTVHETRVGFEPIESDNITTPLRKFVFNRTLWFWNLYSVYFHRMMYGSVNAIITHTKDQARLIMKLVDAPQKVTVIPHAIPIIPEENKSILSEEAKKALGLGGKFVLTIFGFINKRKGYESILGCLNSLPDNIVLLIAGGNITDNAIDRQYYDGLLARINLLGLQERVKITGYLKQEDTPRVMAATDICLAPFSSSSASGALSLCIAYGKPIIASDTPVNLEINERVACLEIFEQGNKDRLLEKIKGLIDNKPRRIELSGLANEYANRFSYAEIAARTVKLYESIILNH